MGVYLNGTSAYGLFREDFSLTYYVDKTEILAELEFRNSPARYAALVRQGKFYWYVKDLELNLEEPADSRVLDTVLESLR